MWRWLMKPEAEPVWAFLWGAGTVATGVWVSGSLALFFAGNFAWIMYKHAAKSKEGRDDV